MNKNQSNIPDGCRQIPLTQGYFAIVDEADYEWLSQCKWHCFYSKGSRNVYAYASNQVFDGVKHKRIIMHRMINNTPEGMDTDHIIGNGLDNRRENLRTVTRAQNMWNRNPNKKGTSKYKGVFWHKQHKKWCSKIQVNKKPHHIGLFTDEDEAGKAYADRAKIEFKKYNKEIIYD